MVAGCAPYQNYTGPNPQDVSQTTPNYYQVQPCCDAFNELQFKDLPLNYRATLAIDQRDPLIEFIGGRSYVEPLRLPVDDGPIMLEIESVVSHRYVNRPSTVLYPVVTLLDEDFLTPVALHRYLQSPTHCLKIESCIRLLKHA